MPFKIYGFRVKDGRLLDPAAVFCNDRDKHDGLFVVADKRTSKAIPHQREYILTGICDEILKVNTAPDDYFYQNKSLIHKNYCVVLVD